MDLRIRGARSEHSLLYHFGQHILSRIKNFGYEILDSKVEDEAVKFTIKTTDLAVDYTYTLKTIKTEDGIDIPYSLDIEIEPHGVEEYKVASFLLGQIDKDQIFTERGKLFKLRERAEEARRTLERVVSENNVMTCRIKSLPKSKETFFNRLFEYMVRPSLTY